MLSAKAPLLFCQNPFCLKFNKKPFSNQAAYTQHIDRNIGCYDFIVKKSHLAATHGASVSHRHHLHEDGNVTCTSNKRPALLRRHMVNDPHMDFVGTDNHVLRTKEQIRRFRRRSWKYLNLYFVSMLG